MKVNKNVKAELISPQVVEVTLKKGRQFTTLENPFLLEEDDLVIRFRPATLQGILKVLEKKNVRRKK